MGSSRGEAIPKTISWLPRHKILTQRRRYANSTPINLHRKEIGRQEYPENANPAAFVGLGQPTSQGVGRCLAYAPMRRNLDQERSCSWGARSS